MGVAEIRDRESLQAWLEALPQGSEVEREEARRWAVAIAHRAAMRVLPEFWEWSLERRAVLQNHSATPILMCGLISSLAVYVQSEKVMYAARLANAKSADVASAATPVGAISAAAMRAAVHACSFASIHTNAVINAVARASESCRFGPLELFKQSEHDRHLIAAGLDAGRLPLWEGDESFSTKWFKLKSKMLRHGDDWRFWVDWYENALYGRPQDYALLTKIALIDPEDWDKGEDHVNALIANIIRDHKPALKTSSDKAAEIAADRLIRAAIGNFTFDAMAEVTRIVPFAEDIRFMRDADALRRVMDDVGAIRDQLETFQTAMERRAHTQGCAGDIAAYLRSILSEFDRAPEKGELRVGNIIEYGSILQHYCLDETARLELRPLDKALERHVSALLEMTHRHFASTFLRFEPLRALDLGEDDPHEMLSELRESIKGLKSARKEDITPLDAEGWAVMDAMTDDLDRHIRAHFMATDPKVIDSLRRDLSFKIVQLQVSLALYAVKGREHANTLGQIADKLVTVDKRVKTVGGLWAILREWLIRS